MRNPILNPEKVLEYEEAALAKAKDDPWRMRFHLMPPSGWLNDPNGLSEINGSNHIFFQYTPQDTKFAPINTWGHYKTDDFINYTYYLPSLYPEESFESSGVYSGSVIETPEGPYAYYTGNVKKEGDYDYVLTGREASVVLARDYDEKTGEFKSKTVLLTNDDYPEEMTLHVRDPKVIRRGDKYEMLLGARNKKDKGSVLVYESDNGIDWKLKEVITDERDLGFMWECPDLVTLDGEDFLIISPQGMQPQGDNYLNMYQSGYLPVDWEGQEAKLGDFTELDRGFDFYAPQTYIDENGRRILIGFMGMADSDYEFPTDKYGWVNALTVPRVLEVKNGKLLQKPLPELKDLRGKKEEYILDGAKVSLKTPKAYELILKDPSQIGRLTFNDGCVFFWDDGAATLTFEGFGKEVEKAGANRKARRAKVGHIHKIQVLADTSSLEIFINDGEVVFSTRYFPEKFDRLEVEGTKGELKIWELKSFNVKRPDGTVLF